MNLTHIVKNTIFSQALSDIKTDSRCCINTINAYSFCMAKKDKRFAAVLKSSDVLLPDGSSIVLASKLLGGKKIQKIAGWDIHQHLLTEANLKGQKVFYLGASESTLNLIKNRIAKEFSAIKVASYSPPYKTTFTKQDTDEMIAQVNAFSPDILFVGMTAPKQEKWGHEHKEVLNTSVICSIGAVFDFYAGTVNRAPKWMIHLGLEWLYRLVKEPKRMWRRYLIGNSQFIYYVFYEKLQLLLK
ncbi:WecB/TagA/CpsF family glycosyltransferase [Polaribacter sp. Q13]|uniref:WecB/TagA/CpsF family glycosyltransferase n=1 Tax=Polaribacter sp. Q13 TaxID=2806551 RepID=UPI00193BE823|nr:WecB/TagA/CpsF family glycosyltransferase [Polaribacter sp. Q13]QVY66620.1 WecB/TagA/CpsF family glycosyltransferase [Polaribacter sp. Q13]